MKKINLSRTESERILEKEAEIKENGWDRKSEWNTISTTYNRKDIGAYRKACHKHVIVSERDTEKHWRMISLLKAIQIKQNNYRRQYLWYSVLSSKEIVFWN